MVFPEEIGEFVRVGVTNYDESGQDVSVGYNLDSPDLIAATVYVYPGRDVFSIGSSDEVVAAAKDELDRQEFEGSVDAVAATNPGLTPASEDDSFAINNPTERVGRRAVFEGQGVSGGELTVLRTEVLVFGFGDWFMKYRFTYPGESTIAAGLIAGFMNALEWPTD